MRIFLAIESETNAAIAGSGVWHKNLYEPLVDMGHEVVLFPTAPGRRAERTGDRTERQRFSEQLVATARTALDDGGLDLVFTYLTDGMVEVDAVRQLCALGPPCCNFSCNNTHQFDLVRHISREFHYSLHAEKDAAVKFREVGATPLWWPMASNPKHFKPVDEAERYGVGFCGDNYGLRSRYMRDLLEAGIDAHGFGPGWRGGSMSPVRSQAKVWKYWLKTWPFFATDIRERAAYDLAEHLGKRALWRAWPDRMHGVVPFEDLVALYARARVTLGVVEVFDRHHPGRSVLRHLHLRDFEAPMCGACYLTGWVEELPELFEPDKEVLVYRTREELIDKARFYCSHDDARKAVRRAARARACAEHTYAHRYESLFKHLGLGNGR